MPASSALSSYPHTTPQAVRCLLLGNFLRATGGTPQVCEELSDRLREGGWPTITSSSYRNRSLRVLDMAVSIWNRRREYDVAHVDVFSGPAFWWAQACAEVLVRCRKPFVVTLHGGALPSFAAAHPIRVERLLTNAAAVTTPSHFLRRELHSLRSDITEIPNAIDLTRYAFRLRRPIVPRIVWLRSFHDIYDPVGAVEVLHRVLPTCADARLLMVGGDRGDGSAARTRIRCRELGLLDRVEFIDAVAKASVPKYLDQADVFLNTSRIDNTPVSLIEAMASGLPIVTSNAGGIPDLLVHERDALLFGPGDYDAMAQGVVRLAAEPGLPEQLVRNARAKARCFDWNVVLPAWQRLFSQVSEMR